MAKWLAICYIPGDHPDRIHAEEAARVIYGDDVVLTQSWASWTVAQSDYQALVRDRRRREAQEEDDEC